VATYNSGTNTWELAPDETEFSIPIGNPPGAKIRGNSLENTLTGDAGDNRIDGGAGADVMIGGGGSDTYIVDHQDDVVMDVDGISRDLIRASVSYSLAGTSVEDIVLTGSADLNAAGNALINFIIGNIGNNVLDGGEGEDYLDGSTGADRMIGGAGHDTFNVDDPGDEIVEFDGEGIDTVRSTISIDLSGYANVENIQLLVTNLTATGNDRDNRIQGEGSCTLAGRKGNDTYVVRTTEATIVELEDEGLDTVVAEGLSFSLATLIHVENLRLTGSGDFTATGNDRDNLIEGNGDDNVLNGGAGADTLSGGAGNDTLDGGDGADVALFSGVRADYRIDANGDGTFTVASGSEGTDLVRNIRIATFSDQTVTLNTTPTAIALSNATVTENAPAFTQVGRLTATDADGDAVGFSLAANPDGAFAIANGYLVLARPLDFEAKAQYAVSVKATDASGAETVQSFTVTATDVAEHLVLRGTSGANVLVGGTGNDTLYGGAGKDVLTGSTGADVFVFDTKPNTRTNVDTITDFSHADDTIWLKKSAFTKLAKKGALAAKAFYVGSKAHDADDRIVYNKKAGVLYYDEDGSGAHAAVQIAKLAAKPTLFKADFFVI
jgi:Ca2+-binding RTX toxin-like protein